MILVPLTQASLRLGIDLKTVRRWLTQAQFPVHVDPQDARKKGISVEHLHLLAHQHQRHLASVPSQPDPQEASSGVPLPAAVLAVPELLSTLQAQITALQQQVADLTLLLLTPPASQKLPPPSVKATPSPKPRPVAKNTPRKPVHVIPRVEYRVDGRYVVICPKRGMLPFEPDTNEWFAWVKEQSSFRFVGKLGYFTAHHEWLVPQGAWRAHRQIRNHSYNVRLAPNHGLTIAVLEHAAQALQAHLN